MRPDIKCVGKKTSKLLRQEYLNKEIIKLLLHVSGGPGVSTSTHPKRSPSGVSEGVGLKEERLSVRKPSTSTIGSRNIPTPSSPMVSSAHNPNKAEIPDRRKDINSTTVRNKLYFVVVVKQCKQWKLHYVSQVHSFSNQQTLVEESLYRTSCFLHYPESNDVRDVI